MMKPITGIIILAAIIILVVLISCVSCSKLLFIYRSVEFTSKGDEWKFYDAIWRMENERVEEMLKSGADPNYCKGEAGWIDSNPLSVLVSNVYTTFLRRKRGDAIPNPTPDLAILQLLLDDGADINRRPYVWKRIYSHGNKWIERIEEITILNKRTTEDMEEEIADYIDSANRILKALLEAGADPDMLGDPKAFTYAKPFTKDYPMNDEKAHIYFSNGTRPINEAIKKGIFWESQVDLLLKYTKLDENSLLAAEESGDNKMIEKINKLWEMQEKSINGEVKFLGDA